MIFVRESSLTLGTTFAADSCISMTESLLNSGGYSVNRSTRGLLWAAGAVAVPAAINAVIASRAAKSEQPLPGDIGYYAWVYGQVAFYRLGQGTPVLLVHNPNAGGSAWE
ncbi:MAG TPA: hypothetical protein VHV83_01295, partial [Armatimonadota bacterium]|nr:hypothetical protein [Armatimonadota bacterium]